jgi:hypothetical protein
LNAKLAEQLYSQASANGGANGAGAQTDANGASQEAKAEDNKKGDDVVDADFKEV